MIFRKNFSFLVGGICLFAGLATFMALGQYPPFGRGGGYYVRLLFWFDLGLLGLLFSIVSRHLYAVWREYKNGQIGFKLHVRLIRVFVLLVAAPSVFMALFSGLVFNAGLHAWFNQRVQTALNESMTVASAYLGEHKKVVASNLYGMALDLQQNLPDVLLSPAALEQFLNMETNLRSISEAVVFGADGNIMGKSRLSFSLGLASIDPKKIQEAKHGVVFLEDSNRDRVRALLYVEPDLYLLIGRLVDRQVVDRIMTTETAVGDYNKLRLESDELAQKFALVFLLVTLLLVLLASWKGLTFATQIISPVRNLFETAEKIKDGNLKARADSGKGLDELTSFAQTFNQMTNQLETQQEKLLLSNKELDSRRRFIEAVLGGVSSGVLGLDSESRIHIFNESACRLLDIDFSTHLHEKLGDVIPDMAPFLNNKSFAKEIHLTFEGQTKVFFLRIQGDTQGGAILTFDDVTDLLSAQRTAAWSDVARRIAHEIKNPLTPIQLSAERLKRKYLPQIMTDAQTFQSCIDTIIRQVGFMGKIVGEFSDFARMPAPLMASEDFLLIWDECVTLQKQAHPAILFERDSALTTLPLTCDRGQITQVVINLLQNSIDALEEAQSPHPCIRLDAVLSDTTLNLSIADNGPGFPKENREKLTDPYVTFKKKGTGLGLAIVRKIVEDHKGSIKFRDGKDGGAVVVITLPGVDHV